MACMGLLPNECDCPIDSPPTLRQGTNGPEFHTRFDTDRAGKDKLAHIEFAQIQWMLAVAITLHLVEEMAWLPAWSKRAGRWHAPVERQEFNFACVVVLVLVYIMIFFSVRGVPESLSVYLVAGLAVVMLANVIIPHLGATLQMRVYAPGLITSLLLNLPVAFLLIHQAFAKNYISIERFAVAAVLSAIVAAIFWPLLFVLGRRFLCNAHHR